jgi:hypothetical protein
LYIKYNQRGRKDKKSTTIMSFFCCGKKVAGINGSGTIVISDKEMSDKVDIGYCKCEDPDPNEDECNKEAGGCGKPLHFCAECYLLVQAPGDNCSCGWGKKRLHKAKTRLI